jgi:hypothetical protein
MNVSLSPELEQLIDQKIKGGMFPGAAGYNKKRIIEHSLVGNWVMSEQQPDH